ncbi:B12-binding domain-containing radical SAM protein [Chromobacterium paludis]|uniref:B12-binding domain-containing radical SAM protein n=1 Tax=Chromobacterium paludis TaxID=2605945 RepID=A0A5C1DCN3_9NEIS|nr:radical SAM protein [Chromobacterium paludis]QEL54444.1 B12-binding domain-containing radical SAM protein [Chromobacterium paludis]
MKVLLITPYLDAPQERRTDFLPSGALLCLAAVLREAGHEPKLLDLNNRRVHEQEEPHQYCLDQIASAISQFDPGLVAISFLFSGFMTTAWSYAAEVKKVAPHLPVVTGGIHATTYPREILRNCPEFDYIALGEGEPQMVELANRIAMNDLVDLSKIKSFAYRDANGVIRVNEEREWIDYENLPMQAWDLVDFTDFEMDLTGYSNFKGHVLKNVVPVISERGCPFRCNFCDMYMVQGRKLRRRSPKRFVDELEYLVNEKGQRFFTFMDDNLTIDNKHILGICQEIIRRGLDIQFTTSGGLGMNSLRGDVIDAMVEAGMTSALLAPEHGSDYIRNDVIKKGLKRDTIYQVVSDLKKHRVSLAGNWIMGFPEDTNETLQETMDMIDELQLDRNWVGTLIPFPGTPVFDQCLRDDLFIGGVDVQNLWKKPVRAHQDGSVIKPYNMSLDDLREWRTRFIDVRFKYMRAL